MSKCMLSSDLPCPVDPPPARPGEWKYYGSLKTEYKCPNGFEFEDGTYPKSSLKCSVDKTWEPKILKKCTGMIDHYLAVWQIS